MIINPLRCIPNRSAVVLILPVLLAGCFFNLGEHKDFSSWYYGEPGMAGALGEDRCDRYADRIQEERHRYFLHFRTPEVLLQPQGGKSYPERLTAEGRQGASAANMQTCDRVSRGWETFRFETVDAGLLDTIIPYRKDTVVNDRERGWGQKSLVYAEGLAYNTGLAAVMKAPVYIVHDILKTLYIPVAGTYYLLKPEAVPEDSTEVIQVPETPKPDQGPSDGAVPADAPSVVEAQDTTGVSRLFADKPDRPAGEAAANFPAAQTSEEEEEEEPTFDEDPTQADDAETPTEIEPDPLKQAANAKDAATTIAPARNATQEASRPMSEEPQMAVPPAAEAVVDPAEVAANPQTAAAASPDAEKVASDRSADADAPLGIVDQTDKVATAAAALATAARRGAGPEAAANEAAVTDAPITGAGPDGPAAPLVGPSAEIVEEDLLETEVVTDGRREPQVPHADLEYAGESEEVAPRDASVPVASVNPEQRAAPAEAPPALESIDWVRINKRKLQKKAAFIGFFSRSAGVDQTIKDYLETHLWPVFKDRCDDDLTLLRRGDAGYPAALDTLVRDQFGRLNSFELTTVARFSGLNAIVAATIIDIRIASAISGILWYKSPEGQLRLTILVEVFDAETGTKLMDRTYIREEEVEELEPGAGEALRPEDGPVLQAVLRDVAEDMGEHVCDTLDDLPWRAYVSGINGPRISLSAGERAGLVRGNILKVYNSQIIDGLNNQQFFLTGEKVGRIQIIKVFPNRSEALLIEDQGLRDYSVAMP